MKLKYLLPFLAVLAIVCSVQAQNLFVMNSQTVQEVSTNGAVSTFATLSGSVSYAQPLAFNTNGILFTGQVGSGGSTLSEITTSGVVSSFAPSYSGNPASLAFNTNGILFEADFGGQINEFQTNGSYSVFTNITSDAIAFSTNGNLFVSDYYGGEIYNIAPNGSSSVFATNLTGISALAFNSAGNLFVTANSGNSVFEITPNGAVSTFIVNLPQSEGLDQGANGLAFNTSGDLFVGSFGLGTIWEYSPDGTFDGAYATGLGVGVRNIAFSNQTLPVPEPSTYALLGLGVLTVLLGARRRA